MSGRPPADRVFDAAIVGGGIAGHAMAAALGGCGLDVAVIAPGRRHDPAAPRAIALAKGSVAMLRVLGIWPRLAPAAQAMERIIVTDGRPGGSQLSLLEFDGGAGEGAAAHVIEEHVLAGEVASAALEAPGVSTLEDRLAAIGRDGTTARLRLDSGHEIVARLVIAADGARSPTRALARLKTVGWSYGQSGIVATIEHEGSHHGVAVERFYPSGPFAILPLSGDRSSLVWTEPAARAKSLAASDEAVFRDELARRWQPERGHIREIGPRAVFPLAFHVARRFISNRIALVGDAAHQVHPLAGQGLNLGLRDVAALAEAVVEARRLGLDHGDVPVLERYERWRRFDTITSALAYDGLNRLFTNDRDGLRALRDLGLGVVERIAPLKRLFMREAAGLTGEVPRMIAGEAL